MNTLGSALLKSNDLEINYNKAGNNLPEKVLQFGEGNFLRAFADWMIDEMNEQNLFGGKVVVVQPLPSGMVEMLNTQDGLYTLYLRGIEQGQTVNKKKIITSVSRGLNPYSQWQDYLQTAENPDMELIISNTTEAGIEFKEEDYNPESCPETFPAKLTAWLYRRFTHFAGAANKGMIIMPCELINYNGSKLKEYILEYAEYWDLDPDFAEWLESANTFLSTLVDRIVPGYPRDEIESLTAELGYQDNLIDTGEIFHLLVIEGADAGIQERLPFTQAGLNVVFTDDMQPYRTRKVAVLNGAHTGNVLGAFLAGLETVGEMLNDPDFSKFLKDMLLKEIVPTLKLPQQEKEEYAEVILERFANPFIRHELLSISLNSVAKWKVRVLPSLLSYIMEEGITPKRLTFSLAALIAFYNGKRNDTGEFIGTTKSREYLINDSEKVTSFFEQVYQITDLEEMTREILAKRSFWSEDLTQIPTLHSEVTAYLHKIQTKGVRACIKEFN